MIRFKMSALALACALGAGAAGAAEEVALRAARLDPHAARAAMLDATRAGNRIVAVGEHGYVLLSDDDGKTQRQAKSVPVDFALTSVSFIDARQGWAAGHGSAIIHTVDGGETWSLQHKDSKVDQPFFSVYFRDAQTGWAAGLWSLLLATSDGGKSWTQVSLPLPEGRKRADLNLLKIFPGAGHELFIAAEQGTVLHSADGGQGWRYLATGSKASLWSGTATPAGTLLVAGLRGKMLRSTDKGASWKPVALGTEGSVTQLKSHGAALWASSLDGSLLRSLDDGLSWTAAASAGGALTAIAARSDGSYLSYAKQGANP
ncbi:MAG: YCF48-related protein [Telluria sp.]|nr:YCF48-related protein [Telluria sp.]